MTPSTDQNTTVVLADDHNIIREGLAALCAKEGLRVVGQCPDGASAVDMILTLKPDFALLDMNMPVLTGVDVIKRLRAAGCPTKQIILSVSRQESTVSAALNAGANAYLLKDGPFRHLMDAINCIREGGVYISPLLGGAGFLMQGESRREADPLATLSSREKEVFFLLVNGRRAKDIADLLEISPKTVDTYRSTLMRKLNINNLADLVKFAIERNLTGTSAEPERKDDETEEP